MSKLTVDPDDRSPYRLLRGAHTRFEDKGAITYGLNSLIQLTDDEAAALGNRVRPAPGEKPAPAPTDWSHLNTKTVPDVIAIVDKLNDVGELESLIAYEASDAGKRRKGVLDAAEERLESIAK